MEAKMEIKNFDEYANETKKMFESLTNEVKTFANDRDKILDKLNKFEKDVADVRNAVTTLESKANTPPHTPEEDEKIEMAKAKKAINDYIRKGIPMPSEIKGLYGDSGSTGGYTIPENLYPGVVEKAVQYCPMLSLATVITITKGNSLKVPIESTVLAVDTRTERTSAAETDAPTFNRPTIDIYDYVAEPRASRDFLDDSGIDVEGYLNRAAAKYLAATFGAQCAIGTGTNQPTGFTAETVQSVLSGAAGALQINTLANLMMKVKAPYRVNGKWACNGNTLATIIGLASGVYQKVVDFNPATGNFTIYNKDVIEMPELPDIGASAYPLYFGDWTEACWVVRKSDINLLQDPYTARPDVKFVFTMRYGFKLVLPEAIAKMKSNNS
jgi:HK97 family phage major capsid protein